MVSTCSSSEKAAIGAAEENYLPIRPKPIKPHVARFLLVEAKVLPVIEPSGLEEVPLPGIHSREGEHRTDTTAFMTAMNPMKKRKKREKERRQWRSSQEQALARIRKGDNRGDAVAVRGRMVNNPACSCSWGTLHGRRAFRSCSGESWGTGLFSMFRCAPFRHSLKHACPEAFTRAGRRFLGGCRH